MGLMDSFKNWRNEGVDPNAAPGAAGSRQAKDKSLANSMGGTSSDDPMLDASHPQGQLQWAFDKGGVLPRINIHDGNHRMIVAEAGERVLTPEQNHEYEAQHPDARKNPMMAKVYDKGGNVIGGTNEPDELYDGGGVVGGSNESESTPLGNRIANRAQEIYEQGKALHNPVEKQGFDEKQANIDAYKSSLKQDGSGMRPYAPAAVDRVHPAGQPYGSRPGSGEKRINTDEMRKPLGSLPMYDEGGKVQTEDEKEMQAAEEARRAEGMRKLASDTHNQMSPAYKVPEGAIPVYDDGGAVKDDDAAAKDAALKQATDEVMNNAPLGHGQPQEREEAQNNDMRRYPAPQKPARLQYDTENPVDESKGVAELAGDATMHSENAPLGPPVMNRDNTEPAFDQPMISEASAKTPLGPKAAPQGVEMQQLPGQVPAEEAPGQAALDKEQIDPMDVVQKDKLAAMKKGTEGLTDLGTSLIHEKALKASMAGPELTPETPVMPAYTGTERIGKGTPGEAEAHKQLQDKLRDYDTRIQSAMDQGTPEGDREAASLQLAKQHFQKMNPFGSAANQPGVLGKIEHGLAKAGNIAGNLVAAPEMALIPGTELNKKAQAAQFRGQEQEATKESLEQAQARQANVGSKLPPPTQVFDDLKGQLNPETGKVYTDQERLDIAQNPGKAAEVTYARKYMKDNLGSTYEQGAADYHRMVAGTKPLNEQERKIADYLSAKQMEDTPANRDVARVELEKRDNLVKQQVDLPFSEAKARFNDNLSTTRALLVQQNADANQRGLKADELQQVENARNSAVYSKLKTAKDALNAPDEQFSNQIVPIVALLAVTSAEGVKRVNKQELDKFVPTSGSFGRWVSGHGDQFLSGQIPDDYRSEVGHMVDRMIAAETAEHIINTRSVDETIRQGAQTPVQKPGGGAKATPAPSKPQEPAATKPASSAGGFADWKKNQEQPK